MANSQTIWQFVACFRNDSVHSHNVPKLQCPQGTAHELRPARRINCCRLVKHCDVVSCPQLPKHVDYPFILSP